MGEGHHTDVTGQDGRAARHQREVERALARSRELSLKNIEVSERVAAVGDEVAAVHERLSMGYPDRPEFADLAERARRNAARARRLAETERGIVAAGRDNVPATDAGAAASGDSGVDDART